MPVPAAIQPAAITGVYRVAKADDSLQNVFGWASVAVAKDGTTILDLHDDLIDPVDLEVAAYDFVLSAGTSGEDHAGETDARLVESIVFTPEKLEAMELAKDAVPLAWWVGFHIPDRAAYERAKSAKSAFSIEGEAVREVLDGA